jgi:asparagine synthase (glutamine-hydrolysing)
LLDGQGADEQLAGYRKFIVAYLRALLNGKQYTKACKEAFAFFMNPDVLKTSSVADGLRYFTSVRGANLLWPKEAMPGRPLGLGLDASFGQRIEADLMRFSLPVLLRYEDRNTMAFGIESRVPFLDHVFVEWAARLPADMRLSDGWTKRILRDAMTGILPERVRNRKTKLGFATPESEWINGPLLPWLRETLRAPRFLCDVADAAGITQLVNLFLSRGASLSLGKLLFRLAIYETWARQFLDPTYFAQKVDLSAKVNGYNSADQPAGAV